MPASPIWLLPRTISVLSCAACRRPPAAAMAAAPLTTSVAELVARRDAVGVQVRLNNAPRPAPGCAASLLSTLVRRLAAPPSAGDQLPM